MLPTNEVAPGAEGVRPRGGDCGQFALGEQELLATSFTAGGNLAQQEGLMGVLRTGYEHPCGCCMGLCRCCMLLVNRCSCS